MIGNHYRRVGSFESTAQTDSEVDVAAAYMDLDTGGTFVRFGAKGPGSLGVKVRTLNGGAAVNAVIYSANGDGTFAGNLTMTSGKTFAAQAITAITMLASGLVTANAGITVSGANVSVAAGQQLQWPATSGNMFFGLFGGGDEMGISKGGVILFKVNFNGTVTAPAGTTAVQALTATAGVRVTGAVASGAASNITMDFVGGVAALTTYGADTLTNGTMVLRTRRSDTTNSIDAITIGTTGAATFVADVTALSMVVGAPAGGNKGAGTINVSTDLYKGNTAYTNPDYAMEWWATGGRIKRFAKNAGAKAYAKRGGRLPIAELEAYVRKEFHLPGVPVARGSFERHDVLLEKVEELATYIIEQHHELESLKARLA